MIRLTSLAPLAVAMACLAPAPALATSGIVTVPSLWPAEGAFVTGQDASVTRLAFAAESAKTPDEKTEARSENLAR